MSQIKPNKDQEEAITNKIRRAQRLTRVNISTLQRRIKTIADRQSRYLMEESALNKLEKDDMTALLKLTRDITSLEEAELEGKSVEELEALAKDNTKK